MNLAESAGLKYIYGAISCRTGPRSSSYALAGLGLWICKTIGKQGGANGGRCSGEKFSAVHDCAMAVGARKREGRGVLQGSVWSYGGFSIGRSERKRGGKAFCGWSGVLGRR